MRYVNVSLFLLLLFLLLNWQVAMAIPLSGAASVIIGDGVQEATQQAKDENAENKESKELTAEKQNSARSIISNDEKDYNEKIKSLSEMSLYEEETKKNAQNKDYYVEPTDEEKEEDAKANTKVKNDYLKENWEKEQIHKFKNRKSDEKYYSPAF